MAGDWRDRALALMSEARTRIAEHPIERSAPSNGGSAMQIIILRSYRQPGVIGTCASLGRTAYSLENLSASLIVCFWKASAS